MQNAAMRCSCLSGLLGLAVIGLALAVLTTPMDVGVIDWAERIFGAMFVLLAGGLHRFAEYRASEGDRTLRTWPS